ncbi:hypothetical protein [Haloplanus rubicundus]|uniref:hypothetical protein n=1 Tax=Haloplanus rubicundus TaxID=1547898 RepID=UPI0013009F88|nr:hypothetical protein [Haloplanus rubicundus]
MALRDRVARGLLAVYAAVELVRGVTGEVLSVGLSVAVTLGVTSTTLGTVVDAGFFFVTFYVFTPDVFPAATDRRDDPGFRILVAAVSLAFALPASLALSAFGRLTVPYALVGGYLLAATLVGIATFAAYFRLTQSVPVADPRGDAFALVRVRSEDAATEQRRYLRRLEAQSAWLGTVVRLLAVVAAAATHLGPCILFGVAAATLGSLFPLLELLVVVGLVLQAGRRMGVVDRSAPDLESRVYDRLTAATRSVRGTAAVLMIVVGTLLAVFVALLWLRIGTRPWPLVNALRGLAASLDPASIHDPLAEAVALVAAVGRIVAVPVASGYAIWYWIRALRWVAAVERESGPYRVDAPRPPGLLLAATGLTVGWFANAAAYRVAGPAEPAFAAAWPLLSLVALHSVRRERSSTATPASEARWPLPAAFAIYAGGVTASLAATFDIEWRIVLGVVFPLWLYSLGELRERTTGARGRLLRLCHGALLFASVFALRDPLGVTPFMLWLLAGAVGLLAAGQWLSEAFEPPNTGR